MKFDQFDRPRQDLRFNDNVEQISIEEELKMLCRRLHAKADKTEKTKNNPEAAFAYRSCANDIRLILSRRSNDG